MFGILFFLMLKASLVILLFNYSAVLRHFPFDYYQYYMNDISIYIMHIWFSSVQSLSHVWLFPTPWTAACQASKSITNSQSLLKFMSIELVMSSNHLILWRPLLLPSSIFPSIRVISNESVICNRSQRY